MSKLASVVLLLTGALLESVGDYLVRRGLHSTAWQRAVWFLAGAVVLFVYAWAINRAPWKFGELIGLYVVFFFLAAQAISIFLLKEPLRGPLMAGGLLIVSGGLVIFLSK